MLTEQRRTQLDGIVNQMIEQKETDDTVQFVVDDFKAKYENEAPQQQNGAGFLEKAGGVLGKVFGGEKIGEAIGAKIAKATVPEEAKEFVSEPSKKEVLADVAGVGLTVAGLKGVGLVGKFGSRLLKTMGLGAGLAGAEAVKQGAELGEIAKPVVAGAAVGAAIPIAGASLRAIGRQIQLLPARFVNSALRRSKAQVLQDISKDRIDDFSKFVLQAKAPAKSANTHLAETSTGINELSNKINTALASAVRKTGKKITIGMDNFLDEIVKLPEATGALLKRNDIRKIITKLAPQTKQLIAKPSLDIEKANKLRQLVDKTLGDRAFLGGQLSSDKIILKQFANNLRNTVKDKAPTGTRELFLELTNEIRFRDGLLEKVAQRAGNQVLTFGDFIGGGLGGIFGGGIGGAALGVGARRALESVPFKLTSARAINALAKAAPTLEALTSAQQTAILNLFADIFGEQSE